MTTERDRSAPEGTSAVEGYSAQEQVPDECRVIESVTETGTVYTIFKIEVRGPHDNPRMLSTWAVEVDDEWVVDGNTNTSDSEIVDAQGEAIKRAADRITERAAEMLALDGFTRVLGATPEQTTALPSDG